MAGEGAPDRGFFGTSNPAKKNLYYYIKMPAGGLVRQSTTVGKPKRTGYRTKGYMRKTTKKRASIRF